MLTPSRTKYRHQFKKKIHGVATKATRLSFGEYGLRSEEVGNISSKQIEASRRAITHFIKRGGRLWIRIFPDKPVTKKPPETRMGGGKGDLHEYMTQVKAGRVLFEMSGIPENIAREALRLASHKLPVKSTFIKKAEL